MKKLIFRGLTLTLIVFAAIRCNPTVTPSPTERPTGTATLRATTAPPTASATQPAPTATPMATPSPTIAHRIGVRVVDDAGEFYDRLTGENFIPRGFNYVRLAPMSATNPGLWHASLNPGFYDPARAEQALRQMHAGGYNVVRIFIDCCRPGSNAGDPKGGVSYAYLANVIDFLNKARANEIYVLMVLDLTPAEGGYDEMWQHCCTNFDGENLRYLTPGGHTGERRFDRDFIQALIEQHAPMDAVFAYDLTNEVHFNVDTPPFSLASGRVRTANAQTYDMAIPEDRQRMMDENLVYWIDQMRASILEVDPTALVTVSFPAINVGHTTVNPRPAILDSTADFVDLHAYLGWGLSFEQYMQRFGVDGPAEKPLILGEFGAAMRGYLSATEAAQALQEMLVASCAYGFDGWLMWTWDTDEQPDLWHGMSENGQISAALAPNNSPDPCNPLVRSTQTGTPVPSPAALATYAHLPAAIVRSAWTSYSNTNSVSDIAFDQEGNLWAASHGGAVQWRSEGTYTKYLWEHSLAGNAVQTVVVSGDGGVWFGSSAGASRYLPDK